MIDKIILKAKDFFDQSRGSHGWDHTLRVHNLAINIARLEHANMEIVRIASILHDIARNKEDESNGAVCHAVLGASMAKQFLKEFDLEEDIINDVCYSIETHRYRDNRAPNTLEAKVLFDADKLDSIGATGIGRAFLFAGEIGASLHNDKEAIAQAEAYTREDTAYREYMVKLRFLRDNMYTDTGKKMALSRHQFMEEFFDRLNKEVEGVI